MNWRAGEEAAGEKMRCSSASRTNITTITMGRRQPEPIPLLLQEHGAADIGLTLLRLRSLRFVEGPLLQLLYISTATRQFGPDDISQILSTSRRNNYRSGVTGALLVGGNRFLQALEGPEGTIEKLFRRIEQDPRHQAIVILSRKHIRSREFGSWSMSFDGAGQAAEGLMAAARTLASEVTDRNLAAQLTGFAELHASKPSIREWK